MISLNARPSYWERGHTREKYFHRLSARVRGEEVAEYLGGKFNAGNRGKDDACIFIKPRHLTNIKADYYNQWSEKLLKEAEKYHISKTAKLYQNL